MNDTPFVKNYPSPAAAAQARDHHRWLRAIDSMVRLPDLYPATGTRLEFEYLDGHPPRLADLPAVARTLGSLHAATYARELHAARLDQPFRTTTGLLLADFISPRRSKVLEELLHSTRGAPVAFYKDCNIRNCIMTTDAVAVVDFDDLTLAPFGYDLAKLVVSAAMAHGPIAPNLLGHVLWVYNTVTPGAETVCTLGMFRRYTGIHHCLTARYLGRNNYRYSWTDVAPW